MKKNKGIIARLLHTIICVIIILLIVSNASNLKYLESSGTGINTELSDIEYEFTPMLEEEEDVIVQTFKPMKSGLQSIQVRIANEHPDEIDSNLTFSILDMYRNELWEETVNSDDMENWRYYTLNTGELFEKGEEYILKIKGVNRQPDIAYKIFMCTEELPENVNLTFNAKSIKGELDLIYNYAVFPVSYFAFLLLICIIAVFILWIKPKMKVSVPPLITLLIAGIGYFWAIEHLAYNDFWINMSIIAIVINIVIVVSILYLVMSVFNSSALSGIIVGIVVIALGIANHYTLQFRQTVVLPSDIYSITTAVEVSKNYIFTIDKALIDVLVMYGFAVSVLLRTNTRSKKRGRSVTAVLAYISLISIVIICLSDGVQSRLDTKIKQDDQTGRSREIGFLLNSCENIKHLYIAKPKGYSKSKVEEIYEETPIVSFEKETDTLPQIIVVMNESFSDLSMLGNLETSVDYLANFHAVAQEENSKSGKCVVSVFGGGTSCSEFEFLTGCSMLFLGSGIAPYQQYIHSNTAAIPAFLEDYGYMAYAVHAANPKSWKRDATYPLLGFDEFISTANAFEDASYCRYWIDDQSMIDEVMELYNENMENRLFEFAITIQGHGGYDYEDFPATVQLKNFMNNYADVEQYLTLMQATDEAFGNLISELKQKEQPTIVLMFGDHLPALDEEFYKELMGTEATEYSDLQRIMKYTTPYIMWANYDVDFSDVPDMLSANFLSAYLLKAAGFELNDYWSYLYSLSQKYPVISKTGIMNADGEIISYDKAAAEYDEIHNYEIIQYSRLNPNK